MNFAKVKLIMIVCLVAANIVIGILCTSIYKGKYYVSEREAQLAVTHLEKNGVNVNFSRDNLKKHSLPVYLSKGAALAEGIPEIYTVISEAFFGRIIHDTEYVDIPGGYSVSIKNNDGDAVGTSSFTEDYRIECSFEEFSDASIIKTVSESFFLNNASLGENRTDEDVAKKFVDSAFKKGNLNLKMLGSREFGKGTIVYFCAFLSDKAVMDVYLNLYIADGNVVCLCANLPVNDVQKAYSTEMFDVIDAVYTFSELYADESDNSNSDLNISVLETEVMYKAIKNVNGDDYYIPVWKFEYTQGSDEKQLAVFDALVGENKYTIK